MKNIKISKCLSCLVITLIISSSCHLFAQNKIYAFLDSSKYKVLEVRPSATNSAITQWDSTHVVYYNPKITNNKLLLWMTGTGGTGKHIPRAFFNTALEQGYRIIALSFISRPAIAAICKGDNLKDNIDCAADFRRRRIYGDNDYSMIPDEPHDAIIPRFVKLLQYLSKTDPEANWQQYLKKGMDEPRWSKIALSGQSQGGGMSQFIGQYEKVARIISFSGGWDYSNSEKKEIANWYYRDNVTPLERCYAAYSVNEYAAITIGKINTALKIPNKNVFALDKPIRDEKLLHIGGNPYHGEALKNPAYKEVWIKMLGSGN